MLKECKVEKCSDKAVMKGFCVDHYIQYTKKEIDIKGCKIKKKNLRLPSFWNKKDIKTKSKFINNSVNIPLLKHIYLKDPDEHAKFYIGKRLLELGSTPPENGRYSCKIPGCKGDPNIYGHFTRGFCQRHYHHYTKGIIDINGNKIRDVVENTDKKRVKCKVKGCDKVSYKDCFCATHYDDFCRGARDIHGRLITGLYKSRKICERPLARFNHMLGVLVFMKRELKELRKDSLLDSEMSKDLKKQISYLDDNLKFIHNPSFILSSINILNNSTLKSLLGGERDAPINVSIELKDDKNMRKFQGTLIKGKNANIAVTEYELFDKGKKSSETVLFLRDVINTGFPLECEAKDVEGNTIHHIKITKDE